jgi:2-isopropylmalate synthase
LKTIRIFDTTLRDGEQSPGAGLNVAEKVEVAKQLERLGVDVIEAGFPQASQGDFDAVKAVAETVREPVVAALARTVPSDIEKAGLALANAKSPCIHTFIATSDIHMQYKLRKSKEEVLRLAVDAVKMAKSMVERVEFSAEDATRSDEKFLVEMFTAVIEAGATVINIPDTVGYTTPGEFSRLIKYVIKNTPNADKAIFSVHCHNDLGLAVANSLAAVEAGIGQIEVTINGIGERAGNAALEEVVMAIKTRQDYYNVQTSINTEQIYRSSKLVSALTGINVQPNKAIVGANAFAHEAGIHQDGILKERTTYEIITPQSIGLPENRLVLGKHSGRHAFKARLADMGYSLSDEEMERAYHAFIALADKKKQVSEKDIEAIVEEKMGQVPEDYELVSSQVVSGTEVLATATVRISYKGEIHQEAACGEGPVDAVYKAIDRVTKVATKLESYSLQAVTGGKDALGEVVVRIRDNGNVFTGRGLSTDVIEASARAYLQAVNKMMFSRSKHA